MVWLSNLSGEFLLDLPYSGCINNPYSLIPVYVVCVPKKTLLKFIILLSLPLLVEAHSWQVHWPPLLSASVANTSVRLFLWWPVYQPNRLWPCVSVPIGLIRESKVIFD